MQRLFERKQRAGLSACQRYAGEVVFFMFKVADSILEPTLRLYIYHITSRMDRYASEESIQNASALYLMLYKIIVNIPAIILGLFCGAWSDHVGRKLPVMLCCFGTVFACLFYMGSLICTPYVALGFVFLGAFFRGCFGKSAIITMALHSYIADVSTESDRTHRLGRLLSMNYFGYCAGSLLGGVLLENATYRYTGSFCTCILLSGACVFTAVLCMAESVPVHDISSREDTPIVQSPRHKIAKTQANNKDIKTFEQPFRWRNIRDSVKVLHRPRAASLRCQLLTLFVLIVLVQLCKSGEVDVMLLFVEREPLHWSESTYGYLLATDYACMGLVQLFILPFCTKFLKCRDVSLIFFGLVFKTARLFLLTFSFQTWHVYVAVVVGCPLSLIISGIKSMISKTVEEDEIGKTFSTLSCGETIANLLGSLTFNNLYAGTAHSLFPGFTFVVDILVHFAMMFSVCALTAECDSFALSCPKRNDESEYEYVR